LVRIRRVRSLPGDSRRRVVPIDRGFRSPGRLRLGSIQAAEDADAVRLHGLRLFKSYKFNFEFDSAGFSFNGRRYAFDDIASTDHKHWKSKSILTLKTKDGTKIVLDAWHHTGVKEFEARLASRM